MRGATRRVLAMVRRHFYLYRHSWVRVLELVYWPSLNMMVWGFMQEYLRQSDHPVLHAAGVLVAAVLLWDVLFRGQLGVSLGLMEEMWSRNLGHLAVSPLRPLEHLVSLMLVSLLRTLIGVGGAGILATLFFGFDVASLGVGIVLFFVNLIVMGWGIGFLVCALLLRLGLAAEGLAWAALLFVQPLCAVFYPVSVLPEWLQTVAWFLPATHVFEGMRGVLLEHRFDAGLLINAVLLNVVFAGAGIGAFLGTYAVARRRGLLMRSGE